MSVSGFTAFKFYRAVKLHFTTDRYDMLDQLGRVRGTEETFNKSRLKGFFEYFCTKFETREELMDFLIANFAYQKEKFIFDKNFAAYHKWMRRKKNITQVFTDDLQKILERYEEEKGKARIFTNLDTGLPVLLVLFLKHEITIETLRIIEDVHPYLHHWEEDEEIKDECKAEIRIVKKLEKLVKYDAGEIVKVWDAFMEKVDPEEERAG